jgi:serine/threonine protein kinase
MKPHSIITDFPPSETFSHPHSPREPASPSTAVTPDGKQVKVVGNYVLGKKLGRGTFCKVRVATHIQTGCKVKRNILQKQKIQITNICVFQYAIKILKPGSKKNSWTDVEREIRVLSGLKHPNVIGLHDILYHYLNTSTFIFLFFEEKN